MSTDDTEAGKTYDVTIWMTDDTQIVREGLDDETASAYEDLHLTAPGVAVVEVKQTTDDQE